MMDKLDKDMNLYNSYVTKSCKTFELLKFKNVDDIKSWKTFQLLKFKNVSDVKSCKTFELS